MLITPFPFKTAQILFLPGSIPTTPQWLSISFILLLRSSYASLFHLNVFTTFAHSLIHLQKCTKHLPHNVRQCSDTHVFLWYDFKFPEARNVLSLWFNLPIPSLWSHSHRVIEPGGPETLRPTFPLYSPEDNWLTHNYANLSCRSFHGTLISGTRRALWPSVFEKYWVKQRKPCYFFNCKTFQGLYYVSENREFPREALCTPLVKCIPSGNPFSYRAFGELVI